VPGEERDERSEADNYAEQEAGDSGCVPDMWHQDVQNMKSSKLVFDYPKYQREAGGLKGYPAPFMPTHHPLATCTYILSTHWFPSPFHVPIRCLSINIHNKNCSYNNPCWRQNYPTHCSRIGLLVVGSAIRPITGTRSGSSWFRAVRKRSLKSIKPCSIP